MKATLITAGIGALAVLGMAFLLVLEKNAHANTKQALADEKAIVATIQSDYAKLAANRAQAIADALSEQQAELDRYIELEQSLRARLAKMQSDTRADTEEADARIAALIEENENLRLWSSAVVPDDIVDWMLEPLTDPTASAPAGADADDGGQISQPAGGMLSGIADQDGQARPG